MELEIPMAQKGWLTKHPNEHGGTTWVFHFYRIRSETGKRVENTATIGSLTQFPKERNVWVEVERRHLNPVSVQNRIGRVTFRELVENYRRKRMPASSFTGGVTKTPVKLARVDCHDHSLERV